MNERFGPDVSPGVAQATGVTAQEAGRQTDLCGSNQHLTERYSRCTAEPAGRWVCTTTGRFSTFRVQAICVTGTSA